MCKWLFWLCCFWMLTSETDAQTLSHRVVSFDEDWKFHLGNAADPAKDFHFGVANVFSKSGKAEGTAIDPTFNDTDWPNVQLPHDWAVGLPFVSSPNEDVMTHGYKPVGGLYPESSIGWYRKRFFIPVEDSGARTLVRFDGIFRDAQVWVNGFYLGRNMSGYLGMTYDLTDYLDYHKPNVIVVRVDASEYEGWFYEGAGIYRHTWLETLHPLHVTTDGIYVHSEAQHLDTLGLKADNAIIHIDADIQNDQFQDASCTVESYITDRSGRRVSEPVSQNIQVSGSSKTTAYLQIPLNQPNLWSPEHPYLYRAITVVRKGNEILDTVCTRFGIKTLRFDASQGFFLNGLSLKIKGVNCHQDHAGVGSAVPDAIQYYRVKQLKALGVNAYRTSHNAPTPALLDACDSLGLLVLDEQRLLNSSPEYLDQFRRLIRRDRSRACVFLWSVGNEEGYIQTRPVGRRIAQTLIQLAHSLDPTRTCTYAADLPNVFHGVNEVIPVRGFNYRQFAVADYHKDHPDQPIIGTEMGSTVSTRGEYEKDSLKGYLPDQDSTAPWWASRAETWWRLCADQPWWSGGFVWTGFDYRGEPTPFAWPVIHSHFGIMDDCGFPKNIYYYYQSWWTDKDVVHISPHWNWKGKEGQPIDVWVNSNADKVELRLNGKSLGTKDMPRNGHLRWSVPYVPGKLQAIAFKQGRKFQTSVETTGTPFRLVLVADTSNLKADGRDALAVNVHVVDQQGREVPDAQNLIHFSLEGQGAHFIGVGNGDPSSHDPEQFASGVWQRPLFNGKCQIILQSEKVVSTFTLRAKADGLEDGTFVLSTGK